jgi:hypothetical protein
MGLYAGYLLPRLTHLSMGQKRLLPYRQRVVTGAAGRVLEIGIGSGLNLPLYGDAVDATAALAEAHRVLRLGGSLRFVEHGRSPDASVAWWQDHLTPLWKRCSGGCHLNRQIDDLLRSVGFRLARLKTGYAQGPRPMTFMYEGQAEPQR